MNCSEVALINFTGFFGEITKALDEASMFSFREIRQSDYPALISALQTYLIRQCGPFDLIGTVRDVELKEWFERDTIIQDFDELLLLFRDYVTSKGVDRSKRYTLCRVFDNLNFVIREGVPDDSGLLHQHNPLDNYNEPLVFESDPFLGDNE